MNKKFTFVAGMAASLLSTSTFATNPSSPKDSSKPNVIVFLVDDMGVMDTSVPFLTDDDGNAKKYPLNKFYRTPGMERLAGQGIRFNQF